MHTCLSISFQSPVDNQGNLEGLQELVVNQLRSLASERGEDKFLTCLHKIQLHYSKLTDR